MSFYVYLPSNVKHINDKFLNAEDGEKSLNVTNNYTTQLVERKYFRVPYEVAVVDVTFMHSWRIPIGKLVIDFRLDRKNQVNEEYNRRQSSYQPVDKTWLGKSDLELTDNELLYKKLYDFELSDEELFKVFDIYIYDGEEMESFLERLETEIHQYYMEIIYNHRYKLYMAKKNDKNFKFNPEFYAIEPYNRLKFNSQSVLTEKIKKENVMMALPRFYTGPRGWKVATNPGLQMQFSGLVCRLLKLPKDYTIERKSYDDKISHEQILDLPRSLRLTQLLFIYTDIIKEQLVGNSRSALIRTVHVENDHSKGAYVSYQYPQYFPVNSTEIDSINIRITDETGQPVEFVDALVAITLHFRPIQKN